MTTAQIHNLLQSKGFKRGEKPPNLRSEAPGTPPQSPQAKPPIAPVAQR
jgi:hypothetical protein